MRKLPVIGVASVLIMAGGYAWACYVEGNCTCAVAGSCYAQTVLPNCQLPTCIIADTSAVTWNVCTGNGAYLGRERITPDAFCMPTACRVYDLCNQQYISISGASCWFSVLRYQGVGSCR
jgi:hypothetical protein